MPYGTWHWQESHGCCDAASRENFQHIREVSYDTMDTMEYINVRLKADE